MSLALPVAAWGQPAAPAAGPDTLAEILVTAQKRTQNAQDVPISITAISGEALRARNITDLHELSGLIPSVNLDQGSVFAGSNTILAASIRGIGQDDFAFNLDPGVGIYVDGVYLARTVGANQNLIDVDRVEVLKGPQGTLFGRNTIGGAISIVTRTPGDVFWVRGEATGGSFGRRDVSLTADIPLAANIVSSITVSSEYQDGYQRRIPYPSATAYVTDPIDAFKNPGTQAFATQGGIDQQVIRGNLLWRVSDSVSATFTGDWTHADQPLGARTVLDTVTGGTTGPDFAAFYNACIQGILFAPTAPLVCGPRATVGTGLWQANLNPNSTRLLYGQAVTQTGNIDATYANGPNFDHLDAYGAAATVEWDPDSQLKLRSISAVRGLRWSADSDADGSPIDIWELGFEEGQHQISEEIQLIGDLFDSRLKLVAGLYYFNEGGYINDFVAFGAGLIQIYGPNELSTTSYAEYLHADYRVSDKIGVTFGGRFSADRKELTGGQEDLNQFFYKISGCYPYDAPASIIGQSAKLTCQEFLGFPNPDNPDQLYPPGRNHESFNEFTPTANLQYHATADLMGYLSFSKGFKSGGWTTRLVTPLPLGSPAPSFGPETDKSYELGIKSEWLDRQLIVDGALFLSNYDQIQLTYTQLASPTTQNAGNARIKGAEIEAASILGSHFSLNGNLGYMDARYTEVNQYAAETTGRYLPKTPRLKVSLRPDAHMHLPSGATLRAGLDLTHTAEMFNDVQNTWVLRRPPENLMNASAAIVAPDGKVSLTIGGTNLTDRRFITTGIQDFTRGVVYGDYSPPREWYATVGVRY